MVLCGQICYLSMVEGNIQRLSFVSNAGVRAEVTC
jgi:hypothetical protein